MKKIILISIIIATSLFLYNCENDSKEQNQMMTLNVKINGLKKGKIYLQTIDDEYNLVSIDSATADGKDFFTFTTNLSEPQPMVLFLDNDIKSLYKSNKFLFFAEPKELNFYSENKDFEIYASIKGSTTDSLYRNYLKVNKRYNEADVDMIKEQVLAMKDRNYQKIDSIRKELQKNMLKKRLFTLNFAKNNKNNYIAPYILFNEGYDIKPQILDSVYKLFPDDVANSKYGKLLRKYIDSLTIQNKK